MLLLSVPVSSLYPAPDSVFTSKRRSPNSLYPAVLQRPSVLQLFVCCSCFSSPGCGVEVTLRSVSPQQTLLQSATERRLSAALSPPTVLCQEMTQPRAANANNTRSFPRARGTSATNKLLKQGFN